MNKLVIEGIPTMRMGNNTVAAVGIKRRQITQEILRSNLLDVVTRSTWENRDAIRQGREYKSENKAGGK